MLKVVVAHSGTGVGPSEVWGAWNHDPVLVAVLVLAWWVHRRGAVPGSSRRHSSRRLLFRAGLVTVGVALLSPLDAAAGSLASAHMVQHVLLMLVAAPLLALSRPLAPLLRGLPRPVRAGLVRGRRRAGLTPARLRSLPVLGTAWLVHTATLWGWHAQVVYEAALRIEALHALQHLSFLGAASWFWAAVAGAAVPARGFALLAVFTAGLQSTVLAALATFSPAAWYGHYAATTAAWGLSPVADQQLAGVIMWVPGNVAYLAAGLALFVTWIRDTAPTAPARRNGPASPATIPGGSHERGVRTNSRPSRTVAVRRSLRFGRTVAVRRSLRYRSVRSGPGRSGARAARR